MEHSTVVTFLDFMCILVSIYVISGSCFIYINAGSRDLPDDLVFLLTKPRSFNQSVFA